MLGFRHGFPLFFILLNTCVGYGHLLSSLPLTSLVPDNQVSSWGLFQGQADSSQLYSEEHAPKKLKE